MSAKSKRLQNRLRIEKEREAKRRKANREKENRLREWESRLSNQQAELNRSMALRIRVERDFIRPIGDAFALNIVIYPQEYRLERGFRSLPDNPYNISRYAVMRGHEAGKKIAEVIQRCLTGELEEFMRAK